MSFFRVMIEEKNILFDQLVIEHEGVSHFMTVEQILVIIESAPGQEQESIELMFREIDRKNGELKHYLKFLAKAYLKRHWKGMSV